MQSIHCMKKNLDFMNSNLIEAAAAAVAAVQKKKQSKHPTTVKRSNVFSDDNHNDNNPNDKGKGDHIRTRREAVNYSIVQQQEALRARAMAVASLSVNRNDATDEADIFDYDGAYDSFHLEKDDNNNKKSSSATDTSQMVEGKKSRYIQDLLHAANIRKQERDLVYERKMALEQAAEEEADPALRGKDKFLTASYKRKLEERKVWEAEQVKQQRIEEANDVTKRKEGMASFYGNFSRNVAMGRGVSKKNIHHDEKVKTVDATGKTEQKTSVDIEEVSMLGSAAEAAGATTTDGNGYDEKIQHSSSTIGKHQYPQDDKIIPLESSSAIESNANEESPKSRQKRIRSMREEKVERARIRYFQRQAAKSSSSSAIDHA